MTTPYTIRYRFKLTGGAEEIIDLQFEPRSLALVSIRTAELPGWAKLGFHQCPHCPLSIAIHRYCPLAANLSRLVEKFERLLSFDQLDLEVTTTERFISQRTTAQSAISSVMGLMMATSGCPHTAFFRSMARFHLPLANEEETVYRVTGAYLLAQYFRQKRGEAVDLDLRGLRQIYENMQIINIAVADRLRAATGSDSFLNAITILDSFAQTVPMLIEESLGEVDYLFDAYFRELRCAGSSI